MYWKISDDPWFLHAKLNPNCGFVRRIKGETFVREVKRVLLSQKVMIHVVCIFFSIKLTHYSFHYLYINLTLNLEKIREKKIKNREFR